MHRHFNIIGIYQNMMGWSCRLCGYMLSCAWRCDIDLLHRTIFSVTIFLDLYDLYREFQRRFDLTLKGLILGRKHGPYIKLLVRLSLGGLAASSLRLHLLASIFPSLPPSQPSEHTQVCLQLKPPSKPSIHFPNPNTYPHHRKCLDPAAEAVARRHPRDPRHPRNPPHPNPSRRAPCRRAPHRPLKALGSTRGSRVVRDLGCSGRWRVRLRK